MHPLVVDLYATLASFAQSTISDRQCRYCKCEITSASNRVRNRNWPAHTLTQCNCTFFSCFFLFVLPIVRQTYATIDYFAQSIWNATQQMTERRYARVACAIFFFRR